MRRANLSDATLAQYLWHGPNRLTDVGLSSPVVRLAGAGLPVPSPARPVLVEGFGADHAGVQVNRRR